MSQIPADEGWGKSADPLSPIPSFTPTQHTTHRAVIIDASGVLEIDLSALAVIDELVAEMAKQVDVT